MMHKLGLFAAIAAPVGRRRDSYALLLRSNFSPPLRRACAALFLCFTVPPFRHFAIGGFRFRRSPVSLFSLPREKVLIAFPHLRIPHVFRKEISGRKGRATWTASPGLEAISVVGMLPSDVLRVPYANFHRNSRAALVRVVAQDRSFLLQCGTPFGLRLSPGPFVFENASFLGFSWNSVKGLSSMFWTSIVSCRPGFFSYKVNSTLASLPVWHRIFFSMN